MEMMRTGQPIMADDACAAGWAYGQLVNDAIAGARALIRDHHAGRARLHLLTSFHGRTGSICEGRHWASLVDDRRNPRRCRASRPRSPISQGLALEAEGFGKCTRTVDMHVGMTNFMQNGPRVPAAFLNE